MYMSFSDVKGVPCIHPACIWFKCGSLNEPRAHRPLVPNGGKKSTVLPHTPPLPLTLGVVTQGTSLKALKRESLDWTS